jgi:hypothetical protein
MAVLVINETQGVRVQPFSYAAPDSFVPFRKGKTREDIGMPWGESKVWKKKRRRKWAREKRIIIKRL